jgi:hypothetical protein
MYTDPALRLKIIESNDLNRLVNFNLFVHRAGWSGLLQPSELVNYGQVDIFRRFGVNCRSVFEVEEVHEADKTETKRKYKDSIEMYPTIEGCEGNIVPFHDIISVDHITRNFLFISPNAAGEGPVNYPS